MAGIDDEATRNALIAKLQGDLSIADLQQKINALRPRPWWQSWNVTALGAMIAAILPVTSFVEGCNEKAKQQAIDSAKERQEIADKYLDRLSRVDERRRTLSFLADTATDPDMRKWAAKELPTAEAELSRVDEEVRHLEAQAEADEQQYKNVLAQLDQQAKRCGSQTEPAAAQDKVRATTARTASVQAVEDPKALVVISQHVVPS